MISLEEAIERATKAFVVDWAPNTQPDSVWVKAMDLGHGNYRVVCWDRQKEAQVYWLRGDGRYALLQEKERIVARAKTLCSVDPRFWNDSDFVW